ncbi:hypothetical protein MHYP_G00314220 [Metynnis hypsauchen]
MKDFNKDVKDGPFLLLYPDRTEDINIPGTQRPFALGAYKAEVSKRYQRITFFICLKRDFEEVGNLSDLSDSDPEIVIKKSSEFDLADTLVKDLDNRNDSGIRECLTVQSSCYRKLELHAYEFFVFIYAVWTPFICRNYTNLFEPIVIDDEDDVEDLTRDKERPAHRRTYVTAREDEYFLAGMMLAVSIVHGGPAPHFLSKNLVNHIIGNSSFSATVEDVKDEEIGKVLQQILEAESEEPLQNLILQNSTMFQTAGCLKGVKTCEKQAFVEEYLQWYIIDRNHSAIERFKDGLASFGFLPALQQHSSVLSPVLLY